MGAMANNSTAAYADWEEEVVSAEKGRREVRYYLKRRGGGRDLVVVGLEKRTRHMSYRFVMKDNRLLLSVLKGVPRLKLRSRREVVDWMNSILSGEQPNSSKSFGGELKRNLDDDVIEDAMQHKIGLYRTEFTWLGSSWTCGKRRKHYQSFCRNGVVISSQDFVFVLSEEGKRLVAYLDDIYEDIRGNKMVMVRWFHKIDEVGFVLPHIYNDREIFFSLCTQDLNIECIDGLATVLSPEHYEKLASGASHVGLMPFVCRELFDNDDVKPFDITQLKGYWKQELLRNIYSHRYVSEAVGFRANKRIRWSKESELYLTSPDKGEPAEMGSQNSSDCKVVEKDIKKETCSYVSLSGRDNVSPRKFEQYLTVGSQVEVLSQDSGIRGCWFRASIIKKHKDNVKVQYNDLKDAVDDSKNLEEWILASRLATPDVFGLRLSDRTIVRPKPPSVRDAVSGAVNVGTVVDAWWHDGWWEGIVLKKESDNNVTVYFPEEKQEHVFNAACDLRCSKEWLNNGWQNIMPRTDVVSAMYSTEKASKIVKEDYNLPSCNRAIASPLHDETLKGCEPKLPVKFHIIGDIAQDYLLTQLQWRSSGKRMRRRGRGQSPVHKVGTTSNTSSVGIGTLSFKKSIVNESVKLDPANCKSGRDSRFTSSGASLMTNLVMSR